MPNPNDTPSEGEVTTEENNVVGSGSNESEINSTENKSESVDTSNQQSEAEARARKAEEEKQNILQELISMREERRELREKIESLESKSAPQSDGEEKDVTRAVEELFAKREAERAKENRRKAFEKFILENKEYHPENDSTGLKREKLEKEFSTFNTSSAVEVEDFLSIINKSHRLVTNQKSQENQVFNPYPTDPSSNTSVKPSESDGLTKREKDLVQRAGWTEEKFKELKKKDPDYIADLLA